MADDKATLRKTHPPDCLCAECVAEKERAKRAVAKPPVTFCRRKGEVTIIQLTDDIEPGAELRLVIHDLTATQATISIEPGTSVRRIMKEEVSQ